MKESAKRALRGCKRSAKGIEREANIRCKGEMKRRCEEENEWIGYEEGK